MKVFISWSGVGSRMVAEALRDWLPNVIQALQPWMSANDVEKGARWRTDIAVELERSSIGIICLTPENLNAPWIHFEAGALSKLQQNAYICTYLYGLEPADLKDPLAQFQTTKAEREDTRKLIHTINRALGELALPDNKVNEAFDVWWPRLEQRLGQIVLGISISKPKRTDRDVLEEILELAREQARHRHGTRARNEGFRGGKVFAEPKRDPETTKPIRQTHRDLHHSPQITWGLTGIYPKVYANVIERGNDEFVAETNEGIRYRVRINNRSGKGSRTKTQPGITVKLYHRPGEEFFRYRFLGG